MSAGKAFDGHGRPITKPEQITPALLADVRFTWIKAGVLRRVWLSEQEVEDFLVLVGDRLADVTRQRDGARLEVNDLRRDLARVMRERDVFRAELGQVRSRRPWDKPEVVDLRSHQTTGSTDLEDQSRGTEKGSPS